MQILLGINQILQLTFQFRLILPDVLLLLLHLLIHIPVDLRDICLRFRHNITHPVQRLVHVHHGCRVDVLCLAACIPYDLVSLLAKLALCLIAAPLRQFILIHDRIYACIQIAQQVKHLLLIHDNFARFFRIWFTF